MQGAPDSSPREPDNQTLPHISVSPGREPLCWANDQYCERPSCYHYCGPLSGTLRTRCPVTAAPGLLTRGHTHRAAWETLPAAQLSAEPDRGKGRETLKGGACLFHPIHSTSTPGLWGCAVKAGTATLFRTELHPRRGGHAGRSQHTQNRTGMDRGVHVWVCSQSPVEASHASSSTKSTDHRAVCVKPSEKQPQNKTPREPT